MEEALQPQPSRTECKTGAGGTEEGGFSYVRIRAVVNGRGSHLAAQSWAKEEARGEVVIVSSPPERHHQRGGRVGGKM